MPDKSARIPTVKELQPAIAARNANELKNRPHLEAVAVIEKPIIFPYSAYKLALNDLCNTSGAFCSSKTVYFWGVHCFQSKIHKSLGIFSVLIKVYSNFVDGDFIKASSKLKV